VLRKLPLFTLTVVAALIIFSSAVFLVFDPLSLFTRSATTLLYPALNTILTKGGDLLYHIPQLQGTVDSVTTFLTGRLVFAGGLAFRLAIVMFLMFLAALALSWVERRLWCRHLCPLGALLGLIGRGALYGRIVDSEKCTSCGACERACPMDAIRDGGTSTDTSRCECGLECADACPQNAIRWGFKPRKDFEYDPSRRALLKAGGLALAGSFFLVGGLGRIQRKISLIRPPGSRAELDFLSTCARCGQCLKVCPTNVLQPSVWEAGPEGMFTPTLDFRRGFCDWNCNECGKVCPTQAIQKLDLPRKQQTVIGRAYVDRSACIPWSEGKECLVCEELCPTPSKAVLLAEGNPVAQGGRPAGDNDISTGEGAPKLMLPYVAPELCIGCGVCQYNCPVPNQAAIIVRAVETTDTKATSGTG
jgi:ferredoxin